ncbi:hypothetical protein IW261DRAFT_533560 [Armillaria novae-zelandiae]|uniref:Uncharacterized protein n=1 Tax=Armillaria novae-zelandiae TaxID=153914 RepID=A0AA39NZT0_9AGAR|nr:hypothetical protein IW261DRAFT_533560 [Armillaria novae-zelandiae]
MFHLVLNMCIFPAIIPSASALIISIESAPVSLQATPIGLRWEHHDPRNFVVGAFLANGSETMVATTMQAVVNFTAHRIVDMTFNYTSLSGKDCILLALSPEHTCVSNVSHLIPFSVNCFRPRHPFAQSEPFLVIPADRESTWTPLDLLLPTSDTAASVSGNIPTLKAASCVPPKATSRAYAIVGSVFGFLAIWGMVSASICIMIRRQKGMILTSVPFFRHPPTTPIPFPLYSGNTEFLQAHGTQAQSEVSKAHRTRENVRMRKEIIALEKRIRRMEARYVISPPPSYRSA